MVLTIPADDPKEFAVELRGETVAIIVRDITPTPTAITVPPTATAFLMDGSIRKVQKAVPREGGLYLAGPVAVWLDEQSIDYALAGLPCGNAFIEVAFTAGRDGISTGRSRDSIFREANPRIIFTNIAAATMFKLRWC